MNAEQLLQEAMAIGKELGYQTNEFAILYGMTYLAENPRLLDEAGVVYPTDPTSTETVEKWKSDDRFRVIG